MLGLGLGINKGGFVTNLFKDATLAFSLRDLGLGAGEIIEVRRDSNNNFDRFTAGQINNGSVESFTNGLGLVTWWKEQNGSGNNAIQNTATQQPIIVDASGNLIMDGNKPSLLFDGSKGMTTPVTKVTDGNWLSMAVVSFLAQTNGQILSADENERIGQILRARTNKEYTSIAFENDLTANLVSGGSIVLNEKVLFTSQLDSQLKTFKNQTELVSNTHQNQNTNNEVFTIGFRNNTEFIDAKISEVIHFSNYQSDKRVKYLNKVNNYYGIY